jgi:hypothetical protein
MAHIVTAALKRVNGIISAARVMNVMRRNSLTCGWAAFRGLCSFYVITGIVRRNRRKKIKK